jgi:hypothetical protein
VVLDIADDLNVIAAPVSLWMLNRKSRQALCVGSPVLVVRARQTSHSRSMLQWWSQKSGSSPAVLNDHI